MGTVTAFDGVVRAATAAAGATATGGGSGAAAGLGGNSTAAEKRSGFTGATGRGTGGGGRSGGRPIFGGGAKGWSIGVSSSSPEWGSAFSAGLSQRKRARFRRSSTRPKREGHSSW